MNTDLTQILNSELADRRQARQGARVVPAINVPEHIASRSVSPWHREKHAARDRDKRLADAYTRWVGNQDRS